MRWVVLAATVAVASNNFSAKIGFLYSQLFASKELGNKKPMSNKGKIYLVLVILGVAASLYLISASSRGLFPFAPTFIPIPTVTSSPEADGEICIQVITPARNPETGEIRDFPTPCDVPLSWEKI